MSNVVKLQPRTTRPVADEGVYTVEEASRILGLSLGSTYALVRDGTIPARRMGGRWVIPRPRFHDWLNATTTDPEPVSATADRQPGRR